MPSTDAAGQTLNQDQRRILLDIAGHSIQEGMEKGAALSVDPADYAAELQASRACFVTLNKQGRLRGCIGHLQAIQPLVTDVADNAFAAAFRDPRFPPLQQPEYPELEIHISVLSPPEPMQFDSQQDLLQQIRPGIDGLILKDGSFRGTFLPSVWESLPKAVDFLNQLKLKAGLPTDHWSDTVVVSRYTTESFSS